MADPTPPPPLSPCPFPPSGSLSASPVRVVTARNYRSMWPAIDPRDHLFPRVYVDPKAPSTFRGENGTRKQDPRRRVSNFSARIVSPTPINAHFLAHEFTVSPNCLNFFTPATPTRRIKLSRLRSGPREKITRVASFDQRSSPPIRNRPCWSPLFLRIFFISEIVNSSFVSSLIMLRFKILRGILGDKSVGIEATKWYLRKGQRRFFS